MEEPEGSGTLMIHAAFSPSVAFLVSNGPLKATSFISFHIETVHINPF